MVKDIKVGQKFLSDDTPGKIVSTTIRDTLYPVCWSDEGIAFNGNYPEYGNLQGYQWRPSADQLWQPCEVEEEVLA